MNTRSTAVSFNPPPRFDRTAALSGGRAHGARSVRVRSANEERAPLAGAAEPSGKNGKVLQERLENAKAGAMEGAQMGVMAGLAVGAVLSSVLLFPVSLVMKAVIRNQVPKKEFFPVNLVVSSAVQAPGAIIGGAVGGVSLAPLLAIALGAKGFFAPTAESRGEH